MTLERECDVRRCRMNWIAHIDPISQTQGDMPVGRTHSTPVKSVGNWSAVPIDSGRTPPMHWFGWWSGLSRMRADGDHRRDLERGQPSAREEAVDKRRGSTVVDGVVVQVRPHPVRRRVVQDGECRMSSRTDAARADGAMGRSTVHTRRKPCCTDCTDTSGGARTGGH